MYFALSCFPACASSVQGWFVHIVLLTVLILGLGFCMAAGLVLFSPIVLRIRGGKGEPFVAEGHVLHPLFLRLRHGLGTEEPCIEILHRWVFPLAGSKRSTAGGWQPASASAGSTSARADTVSKSTATEARDPATLYHHPDPESYPGSSINEGAGYRKAGPGRGKAAGDQGSEGDASAAPEKVSPFARLQAGLSKIGGAWAFLAPHSALYSRVLHWLLRILASIFRIVRLDAGAVFLRAGLGDVFHTGLLCAVLAPFLARNSSRVGVEFVPDFGEGLVFSASGDLTLRTSIAMLLWPLAVALLFFPYWRAGLLYWKWRKYRKKAA